MRIFRYLSVVLCCCLLYTGTLFAEKIVQEHPPGDGRPVRIGYFLGEPNVFINPSTGKLSGAIYDLIEKYIGPETGIRFLWDKQPSSIPRQLSSLKYLKRYMTVQLTFTPARLEFSIYSAQPYGWAVPIIAVKKDSPLKKIETVDDIKDMIIGYGQGAFRTPFMKHPDIKFDLVADPDYHNFNLRKVLAGRIDGLYVPSKIVMLSILKRKGLLNEFRLIDLPEKQLPGYVAFSKDLEDVAKKYNAAFEKLDGQNLYKKLLAKYIDISRL